MAEFEPLSTQDKVLTVVITLILALFMSAILGLAVALWGWFLSATTYGGW